MTNPMFRHSTDAGWVSRSHGAIAPFRVQRPGTVAEAVDALSAPGALAIAGGIDLVRRMRAGDRHDCLVDLSGIGEMRGIADEGGAVRIGGLATHWDIETDALLADRLAAFQAAWKTIGNVRVRMAGTIAGNVMAGERGYDGRVLLGVLGADLLFRTVAGEVAISASAAPEDWPAQGLLTAVRVPVRTGLRLAFDRSLKPVVSVAVALDGVRATLGVGCAFAAPLFRSGAVGEALPVDAFPEPLDNPMGSAGYRRRMIGVLAQRQVRALNGEG